MSYRSSLQMSLLKVRKIFSSLHLPEASCVELKLPDSTCEEIVRSLQRKVIPPSQAASTLLESSRHDFEICDPIHELLGNRGLKPGTVLELSGPPGAPKELCLLTLMTSVAREGKGLLCVGKP